MITRAGVFIGVNKVGGLPVLQDAAAGAARMYEWAVAQGMKPDSHAKLITDGGGKKVGPDLIFTAINDIIQLPGVDQLIIYFAGHGVNINRCEYWLLSDAPVNASAAVNLAGNVELARYCGIKHVVFISDACRVAPEGLQAQGVRGSDIFPNLQVVDRSRPVDQFFACMLGRTAAEIKDPAEAAKNYRALYTDIMLSALYGLQPEVLDPPDATDDLCSYVKPRKLESHLEIAVPRRVRELNLQFKVNQDPDAIITSNQEWLARIKGKDVNRGSEPPKKPPGPMGRRGSRIKADNLRRLANDLVSTTIHGDALPDLKAQLLGVEPPMWPESKPLFESISRIQQSFGPDHFETQCGIKIRGIRMKSAFAGTAWAQLLGDEAVRVDLRGKKAANVLLEFENGTGAVIPAIADFVAAVTFEAGELIDVSYEPSANTLRWQLLQGQAKRIRQLRVAAAAASQHGRFSFEGDDAIKVAQEMQNNKGIDPTLSIYAAYAYHDLAETERIRQMSLYLAGDVGITFFDLNLLGRMSPDWQKQADDHFYPFYPLLAQGWALLGANRVRLHPLIEGVEKTMKESLWSLFNPRGVGQLRQAMEKEGNL